MIRTSRWKGSALRLALSTLLVSLAASCTGTALGPLAPELPPPGVPEPHPDQALFLDAARTAWTYADTQYQPSTGLVNSVEGYTYATVWDIASGLAALYCARRLDLISSGEYDRRMRRALRTLQTVRLFEGVAPNKNYSTLTGAIAGRDDRDTASTERGIGWSAVDMGRLLVWLKIIAVNHPRYAGDIARVVDRIDFSRLVADGYLWGAALDPAGQVRRYPEGRVGYEQYAAYGYAVWGHRPESALTLSANAFPVTVLDVPLVADRRGGDYLTSEPFILSGLEVGWNQEMKELSQHVLRVQAERWRRTGQVTMVSEDHVPQPPYYFYYYAINHHGHQFTVGVQDTEEVLSDPRWLSAKAAFAWYALIPDDYTRMAVAAVAGARRPDKGWDSGVYERTGAPTGSANINTAAVILEAALFSRSGRPLVYGR